MALEVPPLMVRVADAALLMFGVKMKSWLVEMSSLNAAQVAV
jgi:hypothetical protein